MSYDRWKTTPPVDDDDLWPREIDPPEDADVSTVPTWEDWLAGIGMVILILFVGYLFLMSTP